MATATQQITEVPANLWYVHVDGTFDSKWGSRRLARAQKARLRKYGVTSVTLSSSPITIGAAVVDTHS
jgi:hypothetical protein